MNAKTYFVEVWDEIDRLRAMKAELVAALKALTKAWESETASEPPAYETASALFAIARLDGSRR